MLNGSKEHKIRQNKAGEKKGLKWREQIKKATVEVQFSTAHFEMHKNEKTKKSFPPKKNITTYCMTLLS